MGDADQEKTFTRSGRTVGRADGKQGSALFCFGLTGSLLLENDRRGERRVERGGWNGNRRLGRNVQISWSREIFIVVAATSKCELFSRFKCILVFVTFLSAPLEVIDGVSTVDQENLGSLESSNNASQFSAAKG